MFFEKSWLSDPDNATSIGAGWIQSASGQDTMQVISGAIGANTDRTVLNRRIFGATTGGEVYAEITITAANSTSEIYVGAATGTDGTELASAALYARYNGSNTRFQIMRKVTASATLAAVGSSVTRTIVSGDVMRLTIHGGSATLSVNGTVIITSSLSAIPEASTYAFPAIRFRGNTVSRITAFKSADYGVEVDPGGSNVTSTITGGEYSFFNGTSLIPLFYIGQKVDGEVVQQNLTLAATPPVSYPSDVGYGPDPTMTNAPQLPSGYSPLRTVNVSTSAQLTAALAGAQAGDLIELAAGLYNAKYVVLNKTGTAANPIVIRGPKEALLRLGNVPTGGGGIDYGSGYGFTIDNSSYIWCLGFTVEYAPKGIITDQATHCWLKGLTVRWVEQEAIHLRNYSSNNVLEDCTVYMTGRDSVGFGEAYYIGTANSNLTSPQSRTGGGPDTSDNNVIRRCKSYDVTAEAVDIKEGSTGTVVEYCHFDGSLLNDYNSADTWVDVKGNNCVIQYNYGRKTFNGAYSVYDPSPGTSGRNNVFRGNIGDSRLVSGAKSPDVSINIKVAGAGNIVYSDNYFVGSQGALSNIATTTP